PLAPGEGLFALLVHRPGPGFRRRPRARRHGRLYPGYAGIARPFLAPRIGVRLVVYGNDGPVLGWGRRDGDCALRRCKSLVQRRRRVVVEEQIRVIGALPLGPGLPGVATMGAGNLAALGSDRLGRQPVARAAIGTRDDDH